MMSAGCPTAVEVRLATAQEAETALAITHARSGWADHWDSGSLWVAVANGDVVAMAREVIIGDRPIHVVGTVWVHQDHRGNRLGQRVVQALLDASKASTLWLDCRPSLEPYYGALGFNPGDRAEVTPDFMTEDDPPDQSVMCLSR